MDSVMFFVFVVETVSNLHNTYKAASLCLGFPGGSDGKESTCNAETWVQSLGWEDPLEEGMTTHSSILAWGIPMNRGSWWATVCGLTESQT